MSKSKSQILKTTSKWLMPKDARFVLSVSAKNLARDARRAGVELRKNPTGRGFLYSTSGLRKAIA